MKAVKRLVAKLQSGVTPGKPNQRKGQTKSSWISPIFVWILVFFLRKASAIHISNFCSGMPLWKVHELTLLWFWFAGATPDTRWCNCFILQRNDRSQSYRQINQHPSLPWNLSGMFRRSASLALPYLKSFAAIPSVSLVRLGHTELQRFLVTWIAAWNCPCLGTFKTDSLLPTRRSGGRKMGTVFRNVRFFDVSRAVGIARFESVSESQPHRAIQCH